jgi:hypothetical protein
VLVSTTERHPEYVGGPKCGDPVTRPEEPHVTIDAPRVGRTHPARGQYHYARVESGDFVFVEQKA